jgi:acetylornithine deacetylase/succinyl-diaminopimelate desuccinylase-like protein
VPARAGALADLAALVRFASVSSDPRRAADLRRCARWVAERCARAGFPHVEVIAGRRHPLVVAEDRRAPARPTVLLYGHYDVQPPGPRTTWRTPPFTPTLRGADLYGRGASDDKGQLLCQLLGVEALRRRGRLAVNVVVIADGEEEVGSPSMPALLARRVPIWRPQAAIICDTRMFAPGRPAFTVGLRGSLALELTVQGPPGELHSGQFGGAVRNPLQVLCEVLAALHDGHGAIAVPGLYDDVRPPPKRQPPITDAAVLRQAGVARGFGEAGFSAYERVTVRPSLTIAGVTGGHQGAGVKGVIPARASAKLSLRLVPSQSPQRAERQLRARLQALMPPTVRWRLERDSASRPVLLDSHDVAHQAAARACRRVWHSAPVLLRSGGSIPLVDLLARRHAVPTVLLGFALPDDGAHGPNEKFHVPHLDLGARTIAAFLEELAHSEGAAQGRRPSRHRSRSPGFGARRCSSATSVS